MKISVLGCGRWACFVAWYLDNIGFDVTVWGRDTSQRLAHLKKFRKNEYLSFSDRVNITTDLSYSVNSADILAISIASQSCRDLIRQIAAIINCPKPIILCMKGLENKTGRRLSEVVKEYVSCPVAVWVGPGHVQDFVRGVPNCMIIDSDDSNLKSDLALKFSSDLIRFYIGNDLLGNEVGAATKNVMGIAAGMLDAIGYTSLKGALMSRGTKEISHLIKVLGGDVMSAYGLGHLGDYQATLFSEHSHNRAFGEFFVKNKPYKKLSEGFYTVQAVMHIADLYDIDLPICKAVNDILNHSIQAKEALSKLFIRKIKYEFRGT